MSPGPTSKAALTPSENGFNSLRLQSFLFPINIITIIPFIPLEPFLSSLVIVGLIEFFSTCERGALLLAHLKSTHFDRSIFMHDFLLNFPFLSSGNTAQFWSGVNCALAVNACDNPGAWSISCETININQSTVIGMYFASASQFSYGISFIISIEMNSITSRHAAIVLS